MYETSSEAFPNVHCGHLDAAHPKYQDCSRTNNSFSEAKFDEPPMPVLPPPYATVRPQLSGLFWKGHAKLMPIVGARKNRMKKGAGKDSKKDSRDGYDYVHGHFFGVLTALNTKQLSAKTLFSLVVLAHQRVDEQTTNLNRWAKRRMPNAYCWLDENRGIISDERIGQCLDDVKAQHVAAHPTRLKA
jgi:hypothetical protein